MQNLYLWMNQNIARVAFCPKIILAYFMKELDLNEQEMEQIYQTTHDEFMD